MDEGAAAHAVYSAQMATAFAEFLDGLGQHKAADILHHAAPYILEGRMSEWVYDGNL